MVPTDRMTEYVNSSADTPPTDNPPAYTPPAYTPPAYTPPPSSSSGHGPRTQANPAGQNSPMMITPPNGQPAGHPQRPAMIVIQAGHPVQSFAYADLPIVYGSYPSKISLSLGIFQIVIGALCIVFNVVGYYYHATMSGPRTGVWGGIMFLWSGVFGICSAKYKTKRQITIFMIYSIISAPISGVLLICSVVGVVYQDHIVYDCVDGFCFKWYSTQDVAVAMNVMLAILAAVELPAAIWGSVLCCKVLGCCSSTNSQQNTSSEQYEAMRRGLSSNLISPSQPCFGGLEPAYPSGYPTHQIVDGSAPQYPSHYEADSAPQLIPPAYSDIISNDEKRPL